MRYVASSLLLAWITVSVAFPVSAASSTDDSLVKPAEPVKEYGVLEETPNQRRIRLGQPIVASYPAPDYGEKLETPNERRQRLGLPMPEADEFGKTVETPNQMRARLNSETASLK